jgi:hypothetical protein
MSKTIRRKNYYTMQELKARAIGSEYYVHNMSGRPIDESEFSDETITKEWHRWHSDKDLGYTPPKSYVKPLNQAFRNKAKQTIREAIRDMAEEEVMFDPFIKDAGWYYW